MYESPACRALTKKKNQDIEARQPGLCAPFFELNISIMIQPSDAYLIYFSDHGDLGWKVTMIYTNN